MKILGISCYYHDSAACLLDAGEIVAAAQEERFTRIKHDPSFPENAVRYCMAEGCVGPHDLDGVVFYEKPILKFHRILETALYVAPEGLQPFLKSIPLWIKDKLWIAPKIQDSLRSCGIINSPELFFPEHHESHAASAFYPSPFQRAAVLTLDGVGEWATTTMGVGNGNDLSIRKEIRFPHSLGLFYSAFTYFCGFRVNSGEYKLMGLAPYGEGVYTDLIKDKLIDIKDDGSFRLNMSYFGYLKGLTMTNKKFAGLFNGPRRNPESSITRREMDLAKSVQEVTEEVVVKLAQHIKKETQEKHLCLAGGVALNCVANGKLLRENLFEDIWIQPAAGDAGGALGAALSIWFNKLKKPRHVRNDRDRMNGSFLGPRFKPDAIREYLDAKGYPYEILEQKKWAKTLARLIAEGSVIGLHQGRMEFGPRALGNRSIIGDARSEKMQSVMNLKIKYRESFRPFAPSCLEEKLGDCFEIDRASPYMLLVADVKASRRIERTKGTNGGDMVTWVNEKRSDLPAITHVDYSARIQSVNSETNPAYYDLIHAFYEETGCPVIINTSFNVRGEPIVCTPSDAYRCFMRTEMDYLALGPFLLKKQEQPMWHEKERWQDTFQLD